MIIEFARVPAPSRAIGTRLRGACAGSMSGALSLAAHGLASGGALPGSTTVVLLAAASAIVGAVVAGLPALRSGALGLAAVLLGGQLLGHTTMSWSGHGHHGADTLGLGMLTAHIVAALLAAVVIIGAEAAYRIGGAALARILPRRCRAPRIPDPAPLRLIHRDRVILRIFAAQSLRTRAPPLAIPF
ncbi:hypothetical protein [Nocardia mangyaensis]|uniref:hypothetical protein n=1 Tax=Nocardia mangyaensis TaxID=2213200 RepID=UPI002676D65D|nr:hypothetical protein [Nocardia mangyaensis]MDO3645625.1 hypothetical protein [Nocardia mangyaensis]